MTFRNLGKVTQTGYKNMEAPKVKCRIIKTTEGVSQKEQKKGVTEFCGF